MLLARMHAAASGQPAYASPRHHLHQQRKVAAIYKIFPPSHTNNCIIIFHSILRVTLMYLVSESFVPSWDEFVLMLKATESEEIENYYYWFSKS